MVRVIIWKKRKKLLKGEDEQTWKPSSSRLEDECSWKVHFDQDDDDGEDDDDDSDDVYHILMILLFKYEIIRMVSHNYGYGLMDAEAMVKLAR